MLIKAAIAYELDGPQNRLEALEVRSAGRDGIECIFSLIIDDQVKQEISFPKKDYSEELHAHYRKNPLKRL